MKNKKNTKKTNLVQDMMNKLDKITGGKAHLALAAAAAVVLLFVVLIVALTRDPLYGTYKTKELLYMSPLSSEHLTLYEENYESISVSKKAFSYTFDEETTSFKKPQYETVEVTEELLARLAGGVQNKEAGISFEGAQKVHYVNTQESTSDRYMLVEYEDAMWYVLYHEVGESISIWHIFELD